MVTLFGLVAFLLWGAFLLGMIKPDLITKSAIAGRGKVFLYTIVPSFILLGLAAYIQNQETQDKLENPAGVEVIIINGDHLELFFI